MTIQIITSTYLTITKQVRRSWRERLFTHPWRPWVSHKEVQVPDPYAYRLCPNRDIYVVHPAMAKPFEEFLTILDARRTRLPTPRPPTPSETAKRRKERHSGKD